MDQEVERTSETTSTETTESEKSATTPADNGASDATGEPAGDDRPDADDKK